MVSAIRGSISQQWMSCVNPRWYLCSRNGYCCESGTLQAAAQYIPFLYLGCDKSKPFLIVVSQRVIGIPIYFTQRWCTYLTLWSDTALLYCMFDAVCYCVFSKGKIKKPSGIIRTRENSCVHIITEGQLDIVALKYHTDSKNCHKGHNVQPGSKDNARKWLLT